MCLPPDPLLSVPIPGKRKESASYGQWTVDQRPLVWSRAKQSQTVQKSPVQSLLSCPPEGSAPGPEPKFAKVHGSPFVGSHVTAATPTSYLRCNSPGSEGVFLPGNETSNAVVVSKVTAVQRNLSRQSSLASCTSAPMAHAQESTAITPSEAAQMVDHHGVNGSFLKHTNAEPRHADVKSKQKSMWLEQLHQNGEVLTSSIVQEPGDKFGRRSAWLDEIQKGTPLMQKQLKVFKPRLELEGSLLNAPSAPHAYSSETKNLFSETLSIEEVRPPTGTAKSHKKSSCSEGWIKKAEVEDETPEVQNLDSTASRKRTKNAAAAPQREPKTFSARPAISHSPAKEVSSKEVCMSESLTDKEESDADVEEETPALTEKRRKRMLSNRASAQRSRQRRQERLDTLEIQVAELRVENAALTRKVNKSASTIMKLEEENKSLRNQSLKQGATVMARSDTSTIHSAEGDGTDGSCKAGSEPGQMQVMDQLSMAQTTSQRCADVQNPEQWTNFFSNYWISSHCPKSNQGSVDRDMTADSAPHKPVQHVGTEAQDHFGLSQIPPYHPDLDELSLDFQPNDDRNEPLDKKLYNENIEDVWLTALSDCLK